MFLLHDHLFIYIYIFQLFINIYYNVAIIKLIIHSKMTKSIINNTHVFLFYFRVLFCYCCYCLVVVLDVIKRKQFSNIDKTLIKFPFCLKVFLLLLISFFIITGIAKEKIQYMCIKLYEEITME